MATYRYPDFNIIWDHSCGIGNGLFGLREGVAFYGETAHLSHPQRVEVPEQVSTALFPLLLSLRQ